VNKIWKTNDKMCSQTYYITRYDMLYLRKQNTKHSTCAELYN